IGLFLRRMLVRRLQKTVLDKWLVQTFGVLIFLPGLALAGVVIPVIWDGSFLIDILQFLKDHVPDITSLAWAITESLLIIILGIGIARTIMALTIRGLGENRIDINIRTLIGRIFYILILTITFFWAISLWNISIGIPVAVIGTFTVAF